MMALGIFRPLLFRELEQDFFPAMYLTNVALPQLLLMPKPKSTKLS